MEWPYKPVPAACSVKALSAQSASLSWSRGRLRAELHVAAAERCSETTHPRGAACLAANCHSAAGGVAPHNITPPCLLLQLPLPFLTTLLSHPPTPAHLLPPAAHLLPSGNYSDYIRQKEEKEAQQWVAWEKQQKEIGRQVRGKRGRGRGRGSGRGATG